MSVSIAIRKCHANIAPASTLSTNAERISLPGVPIAAETTKWILLTAQHIKNRYIVYEARGVQTQTSRDPVSKNDD